MRLTLFSSLVFSLMECLMSPPELPIVYPLCYIGNRAEERELRCEREIEESGFGGFAFAAYGRSFTGASAARAQSVNEDDVIDHAKARRNHFAQLLEASLELEHPAAFQAVKVVMMDLAANLVARRLARHF